MRTLGVDISAGYATGFLLEADVSDVESFIHSEEFQPFRIEVNHTDLTHLIELKPDMVILEPTGEHYEAVILHWLKEYNIPFKRCTGIRLAAFRKDLGILGKNDEVDAFSLCLYGIRKIKEDKAFIPECELPELRRWWILRRGLQKRRGGLLSRLRMALAEEFPEAANKDINRSWGEEPPAIISWLVGKPNSEKSQSIWNNRYYGGRVFRQRKWIDVPGTCGLGLTQETREIAEILYQIDQSCLRLEQQCDQMLKDPQFKPYMEAFDELGASNNMRAIWLTRVYPIERFMGDDGLPEIIKRPSKNGKLCTYDRSLAQFKAAVGAGTVENASGTRQKRDKETRSKKWRGRGKGKKQQAESSMGCRFCRESFFLFSLNQFETGKSGNEKIQQKAKALKEAGNNLYQRSGNLQGYYSRLLYRSLVSKIIKTASIT